MNEESPPILWVFAGPNGAGKTTLFNDMLRGDIPYVNADEIAHELDPASGGIDALRSNVATRWCHAAKASVSRRRSPVAAR